MTDQQFSEDTYQQIKETILRFDQTIASDIYVISFYVSNSDDDPRKPTLNIGYNTIERWKTCTPAEGQEPRWPISSNSGEAKWNFAFWLQNEELIIGGYEYDPVSAWVKNSPHYYSDEQKNQNFDEALLLGEKIHNKFVEIVISHAQKLHKEGVIASKFGKVIPIIIHELEYYDKPVSWTRQANPSGLTREFENWVAQF